MQKKPGRAAPRAGRSLNHRGRSWVRGAELERYPGTGGPRRPLGQRGSLSLVGSGPTGVSANPRALPAVTVGPTGLAHTEPGRQERGTARHLEKGYRRRRRRVRFVRAYAGQFHTRNRETRKEKTNTRVIASPRVVLQPIMILPQVHLRKPCYDFYFL